MNINIEYPKHQLQVQLHRRIESTNPACRTSDARSHAAARATASHAGLSPEDSEHDRWHGAEPQTALGGRSEEEATRWALHRGIVWPFESLETLERRACGALKERLVGLRPMALVVVAATVLGGGYGTCRALAQHAAAVNGTAAGSILSLCVEVHEMVAGLPTRGAEAAESLSGVSVAEWRATLEDAGRALAVELAAQAVVTALLLLVRLREAARLSQSACTPHLLFRMLICADTVIVA